MFEVGADTGDTPGELQYWVERDHLDKVYPLPAGYHAVRMNGEGEMAVLTGQGTAHAAATIMALGLDPRFDLSHAYWLIAGIAGGSPERVSLGSAAWARWVVDGDLGYEIDPREMPPDWTTGYIPLRKTRPFEPPAAPLDGQVYALNAGLAEWAFNLTRNNTARPTRITARDSQSLRRRGRAAAAVRHRWATKSLLRPTGTANSPTRGRRSGCVLHRRQGSFATTAMEDTGTLQSLQYLARPAASTGSASWCCAR